MVAAGVGTRRRGRGFRRSRDRPLDEAEVAIRRVGEEGVLPQCDHSGRWSWGHGEGRSLGTGGVGGVQGAGPVLVGVAKVGVALGIQEVVGREGQC